MSEEILTDEQIAGLKESATQANDPKWSGWILALCAEVERLKTKTSAADLPLPVAAETPPGH